MPNLTISEILVIILVILIVFGPQRLPEMAQKAGELLRKLRGTVGDLRREFEGEWSDVAQPLKDVQEEIKGVRREVQSGLSPLGDDLRKAKSEIEAELAATNADANPPADDQPTQERDEQPKRESDDEDGE